MSDQPTTNEVVSNRMSQEDAAAKYAALYDELQLLQSAEEKDGTNAQKQRAIRAKMRNLSATYGLTHVIARGNKPVAEKVAKPKKERAPRAEGDPATTTKKKGKKSKRTEVAALAPVEVTEELIEKIIAGLTATGLEVNESYDPDEMASVAFALQFVNTDSETWASDLVEQVTARLTYAPTWFVVTSSGDNQIVAFGPVAVEEDEDDF